LVLILLILISYRRYGPATRTGTFVRDGSTASCLEPRPEVPPLP